MNIFTKLPSSSSALAASSSSAAIMNYFHAVKEAMPGHWYPLPKYNSATVLCDQHANYNSYRIEPTSAVVYQRKLSNQLRKCRTPEAHNVPTSPAHAPFGYSGNLSVASDASDGSAITSSTTRTEEYYDLIDILSTLYPANYAEKLDEILPSEAHVSASLPPFEELLEEFKQAVNGTYEKSSKVMNKLYRRLLHDTSVVITPEQVTGILASIIVDVDKRYMNNSIGITIEECLKWGAILPNTRINKLNQSCDSVKDLYDLFFRNLNIPIETVPDTATDAAQPEDIQPAVVTTAPPETEYPHAVPQKLVKAFMNRYKIKHKLPRTVPIYVSDLEYMIDETVSRFGIPIKYVDLTTALVKQEYCEEAYDHYIAQHETSEDEAVKENVKQILKEAKKHFNNEYYDSRGDRDYKIKEMFAILYTRNLEATAKSINNAVILIFNRDLGFALCHDDWEPVPPPTLFKVEDFRIDWHCLNNKDERPPKELTWVSVDDASYHPYSVLKPALKDTLVGGNCIIQMQTEPTYVSLQLTFALSVAYSSVYIVKPLTCNPSAFAYYLVCVNKCPESTPPRLSTVGNLDVPLAYKNKYDEYQLIMAKSQINYMNSIITAVDADAVAASKQSKNSHTALKAIRAANMQKLMQWCGNHNVPCNTFV